MTNLEVLRKQRFELVEAGAHWYRVKRLKEPANAANCPLCKEYRGCRGCPIREYFGRSGCLNTPWEAWRSHQLFAHPTVPEFVVVAGCSECERLAQAEIDFIDQVIARLDEKIMAAEAEKAQAEGPDALISLRDAKAAVQYERQSAALQAVIRDLDRLPRYPVPKAKKEKPPSDSALISLDEAIEAVREAAKGATGSFAKIYADHVAEIAVDNLKKLPRRFPKVKMPDVFITFGGHLFRPEDVRHVSKPELKTHYNDWNKTPGFREGPEARFSVFLKDGSSFWCEYPTLDQAQFAWEELSQTVERD